MIRKFEDSHKPMIHFSTPISDIVESKDEVNISFKLYRENYDNLDSMIKILFDAAKPTVDSSEQGQMDEHYMFTEEKFSHKTVTPKMVGLSCKTAVVKECRSLECVVQQLSVSYPEGEDFVHVYIYAKQY